jgi:adenosylhomocysteinase
MVCLQYIFHTGRSNYFFEKFVNISFI